MIEFGSDFHMCEEKFVIENDFTQRSIISKITHYANGRLAISALIAEQKWERIWLPSYFCYDVISHIKSTGIQVLFYEDSPLATNDEKVVRTLAFKNGDVLLRVNYFGLRGTRTNRGIPIPVVEDHTHSIVSDWCKNSDADWCVASIRKTFPVAAGGVLWSPKNLALPKQLNSSRECENMADLRYSAMRMKSDYLIKGGSKDEFRTRYIFTEQLIESLVNSGMDERSLGIIQDFDVTKWFKIKRENWNAIIRGLNQRFKILRSIETNDMFQFSLIIQCESNKERDDLRKHLIQNNVYPAILWSIPNDSGHKMAMDFSDLMLSIHCDARYGHEDMMQLSQILNAYYD